MARFINLWSEFNSVYSWFRFRLSFFLNFSFEFFISICIRSGCRRRRCRRRCSRSPASPEGSTFPGLASTRWWRRAFLMLIPLDFTMKVFAFRRKLLCRSEAGENQIENKIFQSKVVALRCRENSVSSRYAIHAHMHIQTHIHADMLIVWMPRIGFIATSSNLRK